MDRRPAWEFAERVQIKVAYSKYGVAAWLSRSRLADCCAMSSFRSPYASVAAAGLRRHGRSPVRAALGTFAKTPAVRSIPDRLRGDLPFLLSGFFFSLLLWDSLCSLWWDSLAAGLRHRRRQEAASECIDIDA